MEENIKAENLNETTDKIEDSEQEKKVEENNQENELTMDDLLKEEESFSNKLYSREIIDVKVVEVTNEGVFVDIGEKKEGIIPLDEFEPDKKPEVGSIIKAVLEKKGNENQNAILSYKKAREKIAWQTAEEIFKKKERTRGKILEHVKGGYIVDFYGLRAFMPLSLSEIGGAPKHYLPVNAKIKFYIVDFDKKVRKIIVSRRQVLEEDEKERRKKVLAQTQEGQIVRGVVSKVIPNGIFVRYQGIEGFVNLDDVAWKEPEKAINDFKRGQRVKLKILKVDREAEKLTFGIKQLTPNPADILKRKYPFKSILKVKITEVLKDGARVHVNGDVYGFISERDYGYDVTPKKDEEVYVAVMGVNPKTYELILSIKKYEEIENRKKIQQYLKAAPKLTLGQILVESEEGSETNN